MTTTALVAVRAKSCTMPANGSCILTTRSVTPSAVVRYREKVVFGPWPMPKFHISPVAGRRLPAAGTQRVHHAVAVEPMLVAVAVHVVTRRADAVQHAVEVRWQRAGDLQLGLVELRLEGLEAELPPSDRPSLGHRHGS